MSAPERVETIATGVGFSEGPVVAPDQAIYVTSITHGRVYRVTGSGAEAWAETGGGANGAVVDAEGRIFVAQNGGRWARNGPSWAPDSVGGVQVIAADRTVAWLTREPIAPNDLCFGPDGMLYVTDPTRAPRVPGRPSDGRIWRVDPNTGATELLRSVRWFPNGIAFGPDDRLYLADTHGQAIYACDVIDAGLSEETKVIQMTQGMPDGMAFDAGGRLVIGAIAEDVPGTIQTWTVDGELVDTFAPGDSPAYTNIAFTEDRSLVIADSSGGRVLLVRDWPSAGLPLHPFR